MDKPVPELRPDLEELVLRFVARAVADDRIAAVALVGSNAVGPAYAHSDVDLLIITEDKAFESFVADRDSFLGSLGGLLFSESFERAERWFFVFDTGADGDLTISPMRSAKEAFTGPFVVLMDKRGALANVKAASSPPVIPGPEHLETLRQQLAWFWHDFAHFVTAYSRGQRWWANGQLEVLRSVCAKLLRLNANLADPDVESEPYWKVELALPPEQLRRLEPTINTVEFPSMLRAARALAALYSELGRELAAKHHLEYPERLEQLLVARLEAATPPQRP